jgi:hypothetical protein
LLEDCLIGDLVIRREQDCLGKDHAEHLVTLKIQHVDATVIADIAAWAATRAS